VRRRNNKRFLSFKSETIWRIRKTIFLIYQFPLSKRTSFKIDSAILGSVVLPLKGGVFGENGPKRLNVSATDKSSLSS
jgi:hypothetical protein